MIVVGVMSGTSGDGIDVGIVDITQEEGGRIQLKEKYFETVAYSAEERQLVSHLRANFKIAEFFSKAILTVFQQANINPTDVHIIGSHGQTVWHDVDNGKVTSTLQIGDPSVIAERTGVTTIANFRVADVAVGGQGAPLASTYDYMLLRPSGGKWRALQNIGGIGNVTFVPPANDSSSSPIAFDTGPGNVLMDWYAGIITEGKQVCDIDGKLSQQGKVNDALLSEMLSHPYFKLSPPKSTGRELFSKKFGEDFAKRGVELGLSQYLMRKAVRQITQSVIVAFLSLTKIDAKADMI